MATGLQYIIGCVHILRQKSGHQISTKTDASEHRAIKYYKFSALGSWRKHRLWIVCSGRLQHKNSFADALLSWGTAHELLVCRTSYWCKLGPCMNRRRAWAVTCHSATDTSSPRMGIHQYCIRKCAANVEYATGVHKSQFHSSAHPRMGIVIDFKVKFWLFARKPSRAKTLASLAENCECIANWACEEEIRDDKLPYRVQVLQQKRSKEKELDLESFQICKFDLFIYLSLLYGTVHEIPLNIQVLLVLPEVQAGAQAQVYRM